MSTPWDHDHLDITANFLKSKPVLYDQRGTAVEGTKREDVSLQR
jgi:hypothetical protein